MLSTSALFTRNSSQFRTADSRRTRIENGRRSEERTEGEPLKLFKSPDHRLHSCTRSLEKLASFERTRNDFFRRHERSSSQSDSPKEERLSADWLSQRGVARGCVPEDAAESDPRTGLQRVTGRGGHGFFSGHPGIDGRNDTVTKRGQGARYNPTGTRTSPDVTMRVSSRAVADRIR
ncbi:hypothetical protein EYF80_043177 [Liparis tanakae]|uniref:Uncharacterized protein n=1 Tax=Liparis tanakae TaxID=230148 RepID=A0A4Z2G1C6_9TELE|nr:hypothetical protein EYF80_043177 [Liparis tanakae]